LLPGLGCLIAVSKVYQNPAVGPTKGPDFLNAAALIETKLGPNDIRRQLRDIEATLGRIRTEDKFAPRTIDLDLCFLGDQRVETPKLRLPDPDVLTHAHLALPLAQLRPKYVHPATGETLEEIAERLIQDSELDYRPDVTRAIQEVARRVRGTTPQRGAG
jgi:2-amino-4-hydroxy-6-hydroxymethyldihydropteridine diphosphokinase